MTILAKDVEQLPSDVRAVLLPAARAAHEQPAPNTRTVFGKPAPDGAAAEIVAALDPAAAVALLPALLAGGDQERFSAVRIVRRRGSAADSGMLLVLASDTNPEIRAAAAYGLAEYLAKGVGGQVLLGVQRAAADPGRLVPASVAAALADSSPLTDAAREILCDLAKHPSATVRHLATRA